METALEQQPNLVPLDVIAGDICQNFGDTTAKYHAEHLVNLVDIFKDMHIYMRNVVNVKTVTLNADNMVELPCDFIRETKIGIINCEGRIAVMSVDKNLREGKPIKDKQQLDQVIHQVFSENIGNPQFPFYNYYNGQGFFLGELYGFSQSINTVGYFNILKDQNVLVVSNDYPCWNENNQIVLEYISDGVSSGIKLVPTEMVNPLKNGAKARFCLDHKDNRFDMYNRQYEIDWKRLKKLYMAQPIDYYAEIFKMHHKYAPK